VTLVVLVVAWTPPLQTLSSRRIMTAGGRRDVATMAADSDPDGLVSARIPLVGSKPIRPIFDRWRCTQASGRLMAARSSRYWGRGPAAWGATAYRGSVAGRNSARVDDDEISRSPST
jgi:hypothetical protein